jgi:hypothetical protein
MCFGDWRAGRLIRIIVTTCDAGVGGPFTFNPNYQRVGISFFGGLGITTLTNDWEVSIDGVGQILIPINQTGYHFTLATHGDLPTHKFTLTKQTGSPIATVIEYIAPEEMIQSAIDEFKREYKF